MRSQVAKKNDDIEVMKEHSSHITRLNAIKPRVNSQPPKKVTHLRNKFKSRAIKDKKNLIINTENQILLQKMMEISTRTSKFKTLSESGSIKQLSLVSRAQNSSKINEENKFLMTRLQRIKSSYSLKKWDEEYKYKKYLSQKLSENSRRIPRITDIRLTTQTSSFPFSRPSTSKNRPLTVSGTKSKRNFLDYNFN